jgi:alpha-ribazole phosphatase
MTRIDLLRHGETETPGRLLGRTDPALSEKGWTQFARQTDGRRWGSIVTSPRLRTREAAERLAGASGTPLRVDDDWAEVDFGEWDGRTLGDLRADAATAGALAALYSSPDAPGAPGGESWHTLTARVSCAIGRLLAGTVDDGVLVVTHAGPMRAALALACGMPFANLWAFKIDPGTRISLHAGRDENSGLWGEIVEVAQP